MRRAGNAAAGSAGGPWRGFAVLLAVSFLTGGCSAAVSGTAVPEGVRPPARLDADLAELLPPAESFPARYPAVVLAPPAVAQAAADLTGVPAGATVDPPGCTPPQHAEDTAIVVGTDEAERATITVELTRVDQPLDQRRAQLRRCPDVEVTGNGTTSTVHSELLGPPVVNADDALAVRQTVQSGSGGASLTQSMLTLTAQRDDVRISATYMTFGGGQPDTATLDAVFTDAVQRVGGA
ncbi:sensor domain-containing protein [Aldersonia sp. NBC_00410]|uniref:sensor domain-containing protein n=1 Tax=Aldersonia sp. NBC_00410 TaxID=2975954 RepID=UPI0022526501|nr:sensor domain-containing protein [Aldersonia sp. NBC_00410]MCX5042587.1 sensor domain-containing protein [Aldersonia sp. NBC_00410]